MSFLKVNRLKKTFGSKIILDGLNLEINEPSIVAIIGNNGVGKSVFLSCLLNYLDSDHGSIQVLGHSVDDHLFLRTNTAFVSSDHQEHLYKITPREYFNLIISIYNLNQDASTTKYEKYMKDLELTKEMDSSFNALSFGTKKKVQLIGCLLFNPPILVCDEIFEGLDFEAVKWVKDTFIDRKRAGLVTLFTSHIIQHVEDASDEIYRLRDGKLSSHHLMKEKDSVYEV
ncbi:ATP-binding cassette domain-containing protein [Halobacillus litoralis]|uniref:ATP-binding cassette domain-containing protein n=1 Tax=Halobacillus litoralis TaxID=45668 RepID=A0A845FHG4_9BACI|nr:ABC transporter ATP-binding protein [Halobacillus litoralis]MYL73056.1 ATP-binding cassette domain-containing protein [Halobacillus litoralis]